MGYWSVFFSLSPVAVPEVFAKVYFAQLSSGEFYGHIEQIHRYMVPDQSLTGTAPQIALYTGHGKPERS